MIKYKINGLVCEDTKEGAPILNFARVLKFSNRVGVALIELNMKSKHCEIGCIVSADNIDGIQIDATKDSLYLNENYKRSESTEVMFIGFEGWEIFSMYCSHYTIRVTLVRKGKL